MRYQKKSASSGFGAFFNSTHLFVVVCIFTLGLAACGGGGSSSNSATNNSGQNDNNPGNGNNGGVAELPEGTDIPLVSGLTGDANYQGLLFYTMTTDSELEPDASASTGPDKYKLVAVNPTLSPVTTETVSTNLQVISEHRGVALSFPKATIDTSAKTLSNYHIDRILFQKKISDTQFEKKIVTTGTTQWPPVAQNITSNLSLYGVRLSQYDLQNPEQSVAVSGSSQLNQFNQLPVEISATQTTFKDNSAQMLTPQVPLMDGATHKPEGWLAFSMNQSTDEYRLLQYKLDGTLLGEVKDESGQAVVKEAVNGMSLQPFPGGVFADGTHLVVLEERPSTSASYEKVVYKFTPDGSGSLGSLSKLKNNQGEPLKLPSINNILLDRVVMSNDAVYMAIDTSGNNAGNSIYRLDQNGWAKIIQTKSKATPLQMKLAGRYLVWSAPTEDDNYYENTLFSYDTANGNIVKLDHEIEASSLQRDKPAEVVNLGDPMYGNADGRIYYGRKRAMEFKVGEITIGTPPYATTIPEYETKVWVEAVVRKADGSGEPVIIKDAVWMAASTSGKGVMQAQVTLAQITPRAGGGIFPRGRTKGMELSEVFFIKGVKTDSANNTSELVNPELYALSASDPAAGMVKLGDLPEDTDKNSFYFKGFNGWNDITGELGAGPHRLLTIQRPDFKHSVLYVNTRQENSLKILDTSNGKGSSNTEREVRGF